jgi:hypothetical protein
VLFLPYIVFTASNFRAVFCARREARPSALVFIRHFSSDGRWFSFVIFHLDLSSVSSLRQGSPCGLVLLFSLTVSPGQVRFTLRLTLPGFQVFFSAHGSSSSVFALICFPLSDFGSCSFLASGAIRDLFFLLAV